MKVRPGGSRVALAIRRNALLHIGLGAYVATLAMHGPWREAVAALEPAYMAAMGIAGLAAVGAAAVSRQVQAQLFPLLLVVGVLLHAVVVAGLAPARSDLALQTSIVAIAGIAGSIPLASGLALLFLGLQLAPAAVAGRLDVDGAVMAVLPLAVAAIPVGFVARDLREKRRWAEEQRRNLLALSSQLEDVEEEAAAAVQRVGEGIAMRRLDATRSLDEDLSRLLSLVKRTTGATRAVLFDLDLGRDVLTKHGVERDPEAAFDERAEIPVGKGPVGWVALRGQPFLSPERRGEPVDPGYCGRGPFPRSVLAVPVKRGERVTGVLVVDHPEANAFSSGEAALMADFARWIAALVESVGVLRHEREEAEKLRGLFEASQIISRSLALDALLHDVLLVVRQRTGFDRAYIVARSGEALQVLASEGEGALAAGEPVDPKAISWATHVLALEKGIILELNDDDRPMPLVSAKEKRQRFRSLMGIPIRWKGETIAAMLLVSREGRYHPRENMVLEILAAQVGTAVENARLYRRMEEMATTDGLTGLFNHRYFQSELDRELERAERSGSRLALGLIDIDFFKKLNDTHGHPGGDQVLRTVAQLLRTTARKTDLVARYGGEEFVVVLPDTDAKKAGEMADRIGRAIRGHAFQVDGKTLKVTVSMGVAGFPDDARAKSELIDCADKALYFSKGNGRDQWNAYRKVKDKLGNKLPSH